MKPQIQRRSLPDVAIQWPASMHPVLRRVYMARGIDAPEQIDHRLGSLLPPDSLGGMSRACELLEHAIQNQLRIVVVGDFDADGATGTAVAVRGLRALGAHHVGYAVPNRFRHGYGLSPPVVEELLAQSPQLLITVDNGIAAHAGVAAAQAHGVQVIITDHHLPGATLPCADAIVNPLLLSTSRAQESSCGDPPPYFSTEHPAHPLGNLAGVGVMFYLLLALRSRLRERGTYSANGVSQPDLSALLDLVALGTVADLVPLDQNNRILVDAGLKRIRGGRMCPGIAALIDCGKRDPSRLVASDLGFAVAPRINAAGRLDDMRLGIECLLTDEASRAQELAQVLSSMNAQRRELQTGMVEQAEAEVRKWQSPGIDDLPFGVVMFNPDWHHGVVGLVASKLKETLHRPVIACAVAGDESSANSDSADAGGMIKASGRSIPGFHLRDALADVDVRHPGLIVRFGGHAMAAGLSLYKADIARFAAAFDAVARERMIAQSLQAAVLTDGELEATDFTLDLARQMRDAGPWGQNFAEPLFDGEFEIVSWKVMGEVHMRLMLRHNDVAQPLEAVMFNAYDGTPPPARIRIAFQLDVNTWNDTERLQLLIRHLEPAGLQIPDSSSTKTLANV